MIAAMLALLTAQTAVPPPPPAGAQEDILIIGERLGNWRGRIDTDRGSVRCITIATSRDPDVDKVGCDAMAHCYAVYRAEIERSWRRDRARARSGAERPPVYREMGTCVAARRDALIADLAERRYQARTGSEHAQH
ncbi:MAG TPA: hypothetical protein VEZ20_06455 [Allosphingosinicella sp.]|nr:hypothetical protein [Allosphingosinicella sp.]